MNSINQEQPEDNYEDLSGEEGVKKIKELTDKASTCFFCTAVAVNQPFRTRPMAVQQVDDLGNFWFLSASDSKHNQDIKEDPRVQLLFQGSNYSDFLQVYGVASILTDKAKIKELWNPMLKTWFTEGEDDPRITLIHVKQVNGYYWDTKHNMAIGLIKRIAGAITGKTLDDSIEGNITV